MNAESHPPVALITGANGGIGRAFATLLAEQGYSTILVVRNRARCAEWLTNFNTQHPSRVLEADLADEASLRGLESIIQSLSTLRLLVNCAGAASWCRFADCDIESETNIVRVNITAIVRLTRAALQVMARHNEGAIINVASMSALFGLPYSATYCGSKAFIMNFTESISEELRGTSIRIQALCPGFTRTGIFEKNGADVNRIPNWLVASPEAVVRDSLAALRRGKTICVPGMKNRMMNWLIRLSPRAMVRRSMGHRFGQFETYRLNPDDCQSIKPGAT